MEKLDQIIQLFSSQTLENMAMPVSDKGHVISTNGIVLVIAPEKYFTKKYEPVTIEFPAYQRVIPAHDKDKTEFTTDYRLMYEECLLLPHNDLYTECERCEGDGHLYTYKQSQMSCDD